MIATLIPILVEIITNAPALISSAQKVYDLVASQHPPTAEEQSQWDAALQAAHDRLQNS